MKKLLFVFAVIGFMADGTAQDHVSLIKPEVYDSYVMFQKTIKRRMNLEEKQNRPFYAKNREIPALIVEAVNNGLLKAYKSDSCIVQLTDEEFNDKIRIELPDQGGFGFSSGFGNENEPQDEGPKYQAIPATLFSVLYINEDLIFDRNRTRMYYYIRSIGIALPVSAGVEFNPQQFEQQVAFFKYDDLVSLFRGPLSDRAEFYNNQNNAANINFSDAFELRLFNAPIIYVSNAENLDIRQQYADEIAQNPMYDKIIQQKYEYDLMEYESMLWEY
ncbi:MAG: gliding motility protein GldN [Cyclobacteriaceae bacterium]